MTNLMSQRRLIAVIIIAAIVFTIGGAACWWFGPTVQFYSQSVGHWQAHNSDVMSLAFVKNRENLVSLSRTGEVRIWSIPSGTRVNLPALHDTNIELLCAANDADYIATADGDGIIRVVNLTDQTEVMSIPDFKKQHVAALFCSPKFKLLAAWSNERLHVWDIDKREKKCEMRIPYGGPACFAFTPDSKVILTGTLLDDFIDAWDIQTGEKSLIYQGSLNSGPSRFGAIACDRAGGFFLTSSGSGGLAEWNIGVPTHVRSMRAHPLGIGPECLAISQDSSLMVTARHIGTYLLPSHIRIWDRQSWELLKEIRTPRPWTRNRNTMQTELNVNAIAMDSETNYLAVGHAGGVISLWSLNGLRRGK